ncbi:MAG TPA: T9SS type A sorting domain-containing protein, partial [Panacibacter sp.]|nr:T9SS type A sorting domain-containing protein [Panacibacter sp.]
VSSASASVGVNEMILQTDGKILTTGYLQATKDYFFTARYLNAQQLTSSIVDNSQNISSDVSAFISPNPVVSNQVRLQFHNIYSGKTEIGMYDMNGKQITRVIKAEPQGLVTENIIVPASCTNGTYFLVLQFGNQKKLLKFQVLR